MKKALKNLNRTYGVELELFCSAGRHAVARALTDAGIPCQYEGYNHARRSTWKIVYDVSVGRGDEAMEIVSPPLKGIEGLEEIERVCAVLQELGARVNRRCGLHVHHDAKGFKYENMKQVVLLYSAYETEIDKMMPASRRGNANQFLQGLKNGSTFSPETAERVAYNQNVPSRSDAHRYYKINVNAFHQHGTIEFRQHGGTVDSRKIVAWVILTQRMMERCKGTRKAPAQEAKRIRNILNALGIRNCASDQLEPAEAELRDYVNERREYFRTQTRQQARRSTRRRTPAA